MLAHILMVSLFYFSVSSIILRIGRWFKAYTSLAYIRYMIGAVTLALAVAADVDLRNVMSGPLGMPF